VQLVEPLEPRSLFLDPFLAEPERLIEFGGFLGKGLLSVVQGSDVLVDFLDVDKQGDLVFQSRSPAFP